VPQQPLSLQPSSLQPEASLRVRALFADCTRQR
jgi:hypothetical protein